MHAGGACGAGRVTRLCRAWPCPHVPVLLRCHWLPSLQLVALGPGPHLWRWALFAGVGAMGGVHSSYLCLPAHLEEPGVASDIRWQFTVWAQLQV